MTFVPDIFVDNTAEAPAVPTTPPAPAVPTTPTMPPDTTTFTDTYEPRSIATHAAEPPVQSTVAPPHQQRLDPPTIPEMVATNIVDTSNPPEMKNVPVTSLPVTNYGLPVDRNVWESTGILVTDGTDPVRTFIDAIQNRLVQKMFISEFGKVYGKLGK